MKSEELLKEYHLLTASLIEKHLSISCMESCTGGLIGMLLSDAEGASEVVPGGVFTYSNEEKIKNGVDATVIEKFGVYSVETAEAMATAVRKKFDTDIGIGITGSMGRIDPANPDSKPGEVCVGIDCQGKPISRKLILSDAPRLDQRLEVASEIEKLIRQVI
ncbi:MAG: nicotinamide-nucleotide amidohydrolase family protein [Eubacterium sp.]|nr:nicotinamide-nucleotide amidohydrolase family protein [Eubacterium sp.]